MHYRTLGKTDLKVSEVGMGCWQLANDSGCWVGSDLAESLKSLYKFVELGGNYIDTAWVYGFEEGKDGQPDKHASEELIGKYLKEAGNRDKLIIASKVAPKNWTWPALHDIPVSEVFPPDHIERQVNDSLRSLGVETIDLMQFHVWQDDFANDDGWKQAIQKITQAGKVKHWGISINDYQPSNCLRALDTGLISTIQFIFNIFHQKPTEKLLPYAKVHNIGLIARLPLDEGSLSGKFTQDTTFADGDFRQGFFGGDRLTEVVARTDKLKQLLAGEAKTLAELALRYLLSFDAVSTVIPGIRKVDHAISNTAVSDGRKLSTQLMEELKKHAWERNFNGTGGLDPWLKASGYIES